MKEGSGAEAGVDTGAVADAEAGAGAGAARDVAACLFASGMAAITTTLWAMLARGKHIILTSDGYRRTRQFVTEFLARFGVESTIVPPADLAAIEAAIRPETRVLFTESPTNPYLRVVDVPALAAIARARRSGLKLVIDATLATPINQRPLEQGADLVIHSATKYLGGHNDLLAGVVIGREPLVNAIRDAEAVLGGIPSPETCERLLRGVKTLGLRVAAQNHTALAIARSLEEHDGVSRVFYPGLVSHPDHLVAKRIMTGFGGVVSFIVRGDARRVVDSVKLARIAPSLGGVDTLIEQPAFMSYHDRTPEERAALGIPDNLIRLSVGVESTDTLIADLNQALERR
ncbi:MAG: aminotransferase class I/II-fold pyridoxal phosphate-dependent enzyme [Deltaproteobacteria bacterium]|nr:aminotransferase class I/II-fold pyridoxal phosphate-dependent enzyme [Deltaproteobacteria bacterium]